MGAIDSTTWQALGLLLTLGGLGLSFVAWRRRGLATGLRGAAWSLLPLAAGLTGVLRLGWEITDSVLNWVARLVFSPMVWLGLVVLMTSMVLFVVSGVLRRKSGSSAGRPAKVAAPGQRGALPRTASAPPAKGATQDDELADIEELLRKHGIT
jgi:hypothetical protein